jgi:hypothetical protein
MRLSPLLVCLGALTSFAAGCSDDIGYPCQISSADAGRVALTSPANDCQERVCVHAGRGQRHGMCTRPCAADGDCPGPAETCPEGFSCRHATPVGTLWCCKVCICDRYPTDPGVAQSCAGKGNPACPRP